MVSAGQVVLYRDGLVHGQQGRELIPVCAPVEAVALHDILAAVGALAQLLGRFVLLARFDTKLLGHLEQGFIHRQPPARRGPLHPLQAVVGGLPLLTHEESAALAQVGSDDVAFIDERIGLAAEPVAFLAQRHARQQALHGVNAAGQILHPGQVGIAERNRLAHSFGCGAMLHLARVDVARISVDDDEPIGGRCPLHGNAFDRRHDGRLLRSGAHVPGSGNFLLPLGQRLFAKGLMSLAEATQAIHPGQHGLRLLGRELQHGYLSLHLGPQAVRKHGLHTVDRIGTGIGIGKARGPVQISGIGGVHQGDDLLIRCGAAESNRRLAQIDLSHRLEGIGSEGIPLGRVPSAVDGQDALIDGAHARLQAVLPQPTALRLFQLSEFRPFVLEHEPLLLLIRGGRVHPLLSNHGTALTRCFDTACSLLGNARTLLLHPCGRLRNRLVELRGRPNLRRHLLPSAGHRRLSHLRPLRGAHPHGGCLDGYRACIGLLRGRLVAALHGARNAAGTADRLCCGGEVPVEAAGLHSLGLNGQLGIVTLIYGQRIEALIGAGDAKAELLRLIGTEFGAGAAVRDLGEVPCKGGLPAQHSRLALCGRGLVHRGFRLLALVGQLLLQLGDLANDLVLAAAGARFVALALQAGDAVGQLALLLPL